MDDKTIDSAFGNLHVDETTHEPSDTNHASESTPVQSQPDPDPDSESQPGKAVDFLSKPPEIRNMIYRNLLVSPVPHGGVPTAILRTSKQVENEAKGIAAAENVIHISLSLDEWVDNGYEVKFTGHVHTKQPITSTWSLLVSEGVSLYSDERPSPYTELPHGPLHWPLFLTSISKLCVRITADAPTAVEWLLEDEVGEYNNYQLWQITHSLCSLGAFFENQGHQLDELTLDFDLKPENLQEQDGPQDQSGVKVHTSALDQHFGLSLVQRTLWQAGRVGRVKKLQINGLSPLNEAFLRARISSVPSNRRLGNPAVIASTDSNQPTQPSTDEPGPEDDPQGQVAAGNIKASDQTSAEPSRVAMPHLKHRISPPSTTEAQERTRLVSLATELPTYPDLICRLWVVDAECLARIPLLQDLGLEAKDLYESIHQTSTVNPWPNRKNLIGEVEARWDPVRFAWFELIDQIGHRRGGQTLDPENEYLLDWWFKKLTERLDDFYEQLFDGRLEKASEVLQKNSFLKFCEARDRRLRTFERLEERVRLRSNGQVDGLPANVFDEDKSWWSDPEDKEESSSEEDVEQQRMEGVETEQGDQAQEAEAQKSGQEEGEVE